MATGYYLLQGGSTLQRMSTGGTLTNLTLPTGVSLSSTMRPRFAILNKQIVMVNSPSQNLWIAPDGTVRRMSIQPPASAPIAASTGSGNLTGVYKVACAFGVIDMYGNLLAMSEFGPMSTGTTCVNSKLAITGIPVATQAEVNVRILARTTAGGSVLFEWIRVEGNVKTTVTDDLADAGLQLVAVPDDLGLPPGSGAGNSFEMVVPWRDRLWGKSPASIDNLFYSSIGKHYAWPSDNTIPIPSLGNDTRGITALIVRRDQLGVGRLDSLWRIAGTSSSSFAAARVEEGDDVGPVSQDSVVVVRDRAFYLSRTGVNIWPGTQQDIESISRAKVHSWFNTDTYFNRARFQYSYGWYDPVQNTYNLALTAAGSSVEDRWISYELSTGRWLGPHKTGAFTMAFGTLVQDANGFEVPVLASSAGFLYQMNRSSRSDDGTAVDFDVDSCFLVGSSADEEQYWGLLSAMSRIESAGTLTITPKVGGLDASAGGAITHTLTTGRELLTRLGRGRLAQLNFRQNTDAQDVMLYGVTLPNHRIGRR